MSETRNLSWIDYSSLLIMMVFIFILVAVEMHLNTTKIIKEIKQSANCAEVKNANN